LGLVTHTLDKLSGSLTCGCGVSRSLGMLSKEEERRGSRWRYALD